MQEGTVKSLIGSRYARSITILGAAAILALVLLAATPANATSFPNAVSPADGTVSGAVADINNQSVAGVTVALLNGGTAVAQMTTGTDGQFTLTAAAGTYTLRLNKTGFDTDESSVRINAGQTTDAGTFLLYATSYLWIPVLGSIAVGSVVVWWLMKRRERIVNGRRP